MKTKILIFISGLIALWYLYSRNVNQAYERGKLACEKDVITKEIIVYKKQEQIKVKSDEEINRLSDDELRNWLLSKYSYNNK